MAGKKQAATSGVNFINVLHTAFTLVDPESVKRYWWLNYIFWAFGIYEHKSCMLNVDEIDPTFYKRVFCINVFLALNVSRKSCQKALLYVKFVRLTLIDEIDGRCFFLFIYFNFCNIFSFNEINIWFVNIVPQRVKFP